MNQTKKKIEIEELFTLPRQYAGVPSPDGRQIAFLSTETGRVELFLYDLASAEVHQLTEGELPETPRAFHQWTFDSKSILFAKDPIHGNEKNNLFRLSVADRSLTQLTDTPEHRDDLGRQIPETDSIAFYSDRDDGKTQIFRVNLDGSDLAQLSHFDGMISLFTNLEVSPDGQWIFFTGTQSLNPQNREIYRLSVSDGQIEPFFSVREGSKEDLAGITPDGNFLLVTSDESGLDRAGLVNLSSREVRWFGPNTHDERAATTTSDSKYLLCQRMVDAEVRAVAYDISDGREVVASFAPGLVGFDYALAGTHKVLVAYQDSTHRLSYFLWDIDTQESELIIPASYGGYDPTRDFHPDEYVSYPSSEGTIVHAILYKPKDVPAGTKLPALVDIHGGPTAQYLRAFSIPDQLLADNGYVVLKPNNRGSTGYGTAYRDACLNDWGGRDLEDVEAGVTFLRGLEYVDPDSIAIFGGSYGGYMTYIALTKKPSLFKAGCAIVGITDLKLLHQTGQKTFPFLTQWLEKQMGTPDNEETLKLWEDRSAINFAHQMNANLMILHTKNDPRCPLDQAETFKTKLEELGKSDLLEYIVFEDQGHGSARNEHLIVTYSTILDFFDRNLK